MKQKKNLFALTLATSLTMACWGASAAGATDELQRADELARQGNIPAALELLKPLTAQADGPVRAFALQIYLLTDTQQFARAQAEADRAVRQLPKEPAVWLARGYANRRAGQPGLAVLSYREVLKLEPENRDARQGLVYALKDLGSTATAWDIARKAPELFDAALLDELRHAKAVDLYRVARAGAASETQRKALLDESAALLAKPGVLSRNELSDLLVVLAEKGDHARVVTLYEQARQGQGVADWAQVAVAGSYSNLGQLAAAAKLLEAAHQARPSDREVTYALVYAYCDLQRFAQARSLIDSFVAALPAQSTELPFARQLQVQVALWFGDLHRVGQLLATARKAHPDHPGIEKVHVAWLNAQGRGIDARKRLAALITTNPDDIEARAMLAQTLADSQPDAAQEALTSLSAEHPDDRRVIRAQSDVARLRRGEISISVGSGGDRDSSDHTWTLSAVSPSFGAYGSRVVAEHAQSANTLKSGVVHQRQDAVGVTQPLGPNWTAQALLVRNPLTGDTGARIKLNGDLVSRLGVSLRASTLDGEVPARAVSQGVTARSASLELKPRLSEGVATSLTLSRQALSDENVRLGVSVVASGRMSALGDFVPDWAVRAGADRASRTDVSYFSPSQDSWSELELGLRLPVWNITGQQALSLRPYVGLGTFKQTSFSTLTTTNMGVSASWRLMRDTSVSFDAHSVRRPYDGAYTRQTSARFSLSTQLP